MNRELKRHFDDYGKSKKISKMKTQFITDSSGKKISAILPIKEYEQMIEKLDELNCIKAYDKAKGKKQQFVPLNHALREVERKRK